MSWILMFLLAVLPPCQTEDSTWCGWDAKSLGNGQGSSFVDLGGIVIR